MGTNYYIETSCTNPCEHCSPSRPHIGKSSAGWRFLADADDMGTRSWPELKARIGAAVVTDEYGEVIDDLIGRIEAKSDLRSHVRDAEYPEWMTPRDDTEDGPVDFTEGGFT